MALSIFGQQNQVDPGFRPFQRYIGRDEVMKRATQPIAPQVIPVTPGFSQTPPPALGGIAVPPGGAMGGASPQPIPPVNPVPPQPVPPAPVSPPIQPVNPQVRQPIQPVNPGQPNQRTMPQAQRVPTVGRRPPMLSLANRF